MKIVYTILFILVAIFIVAVTYIVYFIKTVSLDLSIDKARVNFPDILLSLTNVANGKNIQIPVVATITANNIFPITIKNLYISGSYLGITVFETNRSSLKLNDIKIPSNPKDFRIVDSVSFVSSVASINLIKDIISDRNPTVNIILDINLFGIKKSFGFPYTINIK